MIVELAEYLSGCPALDGERVCVNYLEGTVGSVALEASGVKTDVRKYTDGECFYSEKFLLALRAACSKANSINRETAEKCRCIEKWIEAQDSEGRLPCSGDGARIVSLAVSKGFSPVSNSSVDARYEAEIELGFCLS